MRRASILTGLILGSLALSRLRAADPVADIDAQYQNVLAALKKPAVSGILVTEVQPDSSAANAGIRAGDIVTEYYGQHVTTLKELREQVAQAIARHLTDDTAGKNVLARVRRGNQELLIQLPREPLGFRSVEVETNVPGPRNPPPNQRGTLELLWKQTLDTLAADNGPIPFRTSQRIESEIPFDPALPDAVGPIEDNWIGWQVCTLTPEGNSALSGTLDFYRLDPLTTPKDEHDIPTEHTSFSFRLHTGDFKIAPAFVLDEVTAHYSTTAGQENAQASATAKRLGEKLQTTLTLTKVVPQDAVAAKGADEHFENSAPLNSAPQAALPWIAAAMPHDADSSLAVSLLSVRDFLPRPGYVLASRGKQPLPVDLGTFTTTAPATAPSSALPSPKDNGPTTAWRVDLLHVGVVIESYWFTDTCRLLCIQTQGTQPLITRRSDSVETASTPRDRRPASRPATLPAATPVPTGAL